jgi:hypothetical protein
MISFEDAAEFTCRKEAHPGGMTRLITLDLKRPEKLVERGADAIATVDPNNPGKAVLLTQLFPSEQVFTVLRALSPIEKALKNAGVPANSLPQLVQAVAGSTGEGQNCYSIPTDLTSAFAFDRVEAGQVKVKIGLPGDGLCRMNLTKLEAVFQIPPKLAEPLQAAANGKQGFLGKDAARIANGQSTTISLHSARGAVNAHIP